MFNILARLTLTFNADGSRLRVLSLKASALYAFVPTGGLKLIAFKTIQARAEARKGGAEALRRLLPPKADPQALAKLRDDRVLAEMTKRVFSAGFSWSVIESKWPGFEEAFLEFDPKRLLSEPDEFWHARTMDARIVRNGAKIASVRDNARFVLEVAKEHGSFGKFLANRPPANEVGLLEAFAKRGSHLGGNSGQMLLRFLGYDAFVATKDVALCLRDAGLDIAATPTSKRDLMKIQELFNAWAKQTGLPYRHMSLICAMSIGENHEGDRYGSDVIGGGA